MAAMWSIRNQMVKRQKRLCIFQQSPVMWPKADVEKEINSINTVLYSAFTLSQIVVADVDD